MPVIQPYLRNQKIVRVPPRSARNKRPPVVEEAPSVPVAEETVPVSVEETVPVTVAVEETVAAPVEETAPTIEEAPVPESAPAPDLAAFLEGNSQDVQEAIATGSYDAYVGELHALEEAGKKRKKVLAALEARIA